MTPKKPLTKKALKKMFKCVTCKKEITSADNKKGQFCSERCQMLDLSKWLKEEYSVPAYDNFEQ